MGDRTGCGGLGCILPLLIALLALGYYAYTNRPLQVVYEQESTQDTIEHARQIQEERHRGIETGR